PPRQGGGPSPTDDSPGLKAIAVEGERRSIRTATRAFRRFDADSLAPSSRSLDNPPDEPGLLEVRVHEGGWQSLHDLHDRAPTSATTAERIDTGPATRREHVALVFEGMLKVPRTGVYEFHLSSDDGSRLHINDSMQIDNDGLHGHLEKSAAVPLQAGWHPLRVEWFNSVGDGSLELEWEGPGLSRRHLRSTDLGLQPRP
ncbi:MAG: PA14 domain-containing protein, partial [Phycisphaerales bacterium]|nr:PA14 domain-containing protein [Phycisphaerales bacterium]